MLPLGTVQRDALQHQDHVVVDDLDVVDGRDRAPAMPAPDLMRSTPVPEGGGVTAPRHRALGATISSIRQRGVIFFSAAYLAAASLTIGRMTLSSELYQSEVIFQSLPSHGWMRPVRALVVGAGRLDRLSMPSKPSCLMRSAVRLRFSRPQRTCSPVSGLLAELLLRGADRLDAEHGVDHAAVVEDLAEVVLARRALALVVDVNLSDPRARLNLPAVLQVSAL